LPRKAPLTLPAALAALTLMTAGSLWAIQTQVVRTDTFTDLAPGELHAVSLSDQGWLSLAPELHSLAKPDVEIVWALAVDPSGYVFCATGHGGKILSVDKKGSSTLHLDADAPEVTALLFAGENLYAGAAPDGKLLVCDPPGTATLVFDTGQKYIWDLLAAPDGNLFVATGPKGQIFKVNPKEKKGELFFDAPDENVLSLAFDPKGRLHASTQGKGRVYRWDDGRTTPVVLFEAADDEIRRLVIDPQGRVYAGVNSEVMTRRVVSPLGAIMGRANSGAPGAPGEGGAPPGAPSSPSGPRPMTPSVPSGKSEVFLIDPDGFVRSLWKLTEAPIHDMAYDGRQEGLLVAAGSKGKLFRVDARGKYWVVSSVEEEQAFVLQEAGKDVYVATVGPTVLYRLGEQTAAEGSYLSAPVNAGRSVRWGALRREGADCQTIEIETRSGNTAEPDGTWYDWAPVQWGDPVTDGQIQSPVARYLQWRAKIKEQHGRRPELDLVEVFYVPSNEAPQIKNLTVKVVGGSPAAAAGAGNPGGSAPRPAMPPPMSGPPAPGAPKTDGGDGRSAGVGENSNPERIEIAWQVEDPNDDQIQSAVYFKGEDERVWKLIKDEWTQPKYVFPTGTLPDGAYRVKVCVTDKPSNAGAQARTDELVSDQFLVDNTPPKVESVKGTLQAGQWKVEAVVSDATALIADVKYNIDGQEWHVLQPADGLYDERTEQLAFETDTLKGEEHVLGLVVTDRAGNTAVGKLLLRP